MRKQRSYSYARGNPLPLPLFPRAGEGIHIFLLEPETPLAGGVGVGGVSLLLHMLLAEGRKPGKSGSTTSQSWGREVMQCQEFSGHSESPKLEPSTHPPPSVGCSNHLNTVQCPRTPLWQKGKRSGSDLKCSVSAGRAD